MKNILIKIRDNHEALFRVFLFLLTLVVIVYVFPRQAKFKYEFTKGKPWMHETIIAPFDFSVLKSNAVLDNEQQIVKEQHTPIFNYNNEIFEIQAEDFVKQFEEKWSSNNKIKKDEKFTFYNLFKQKKIDSKIKKHNLVNFGYLIWTILYTQEKLEFLSKLIKGCQSIYQANSM